MSDHDKPEALRLADAIDCPGSLIYSEATQARADAAAELRRLHAENERLRGLCKWASGQLWEVGQYAEADAILSKLDAAISAREQAWAVIRSGIR